jgi:hypothetical protein
MAQNIEKCVVGKQCLFHLRILKGHSFIRGLLVYIENERFSC